MRLAAPATPADYPHTPNLGGFLEDAGLAAAVRLGGGAVSPQRFPHAKR
jgi:hypothetical protein